MFGAVPPLGWACAGVEHPAIGVFSQRVAKSGQLAGLRNCAAKMSPMATPRSRIFDRTKAVICHCISRCVRRLHLFGLDARREALRARLVQLTAIFAVDVLEWSLLTNHFHLVCATHPDLASLWTDEEVARRWRTLSPDYFWRRRNKVDLALPAQPEEIHQALQNPALIARWRCDLADISVFHKFLKQKLARVINLQDDVTGHCFEGRFKSIVALDEEAMIAHMVYVALNPIRASMADSLEECEFSSIAERIEQLAQRIRAGEYAGPVEEARGKLRAAALLPALPCSPGRNAEQTPRLPDGRENPWFGGRTPSLLGYDDGGLGLASFLVHVDALGRMRRSEKSGVIAAEKPSPLAGLEHLLGATWRGGWSAAAEPSGDRPGRLGLMIEQVESAMARGLASPIGNFSGSETSLARLAKETGRMAVAAVAGLLKSGARRARAAPTEDEAR